MGGSAHVPLDRFHVGAAGPLTAGGGAEEAAFAVLHKELIRREGIHKGEVRLAILQEALTAFVVGDDAFKAMLTRSDFFVFKEKLMRLNLPLCGELIAEDLADRAAVDAHQVSRSTVPDFGAGHLAWLRRHHTALDHRQSHLSLAVWKHEQLVLSPPLAQ